MSDAPLSDLSDEELDVELTIAASSPLRDERYAALLAELERRRGTDSRG